MALSGGGGGGISEVMLRDAVEQSLEIDNRTSFQMDDAHAKYLASCFLQRLESDLAHHRKFETASHISGSWEGYFQHCVL